MLINLKQKPFQFFKIMACAVIFITSFAGYALSDIVAPDPTVFFYAIDDGRAHFDTTVTDAGGTVDTDLLSGLTSNTNSWVRTNGDSDTVYTITSTNNGNRSYNDSRFANVGGGVTSGGGIQMTASSINSEGTGLTFTFENPVNAFGVELDDWATCCHPSNLYISFDDGTPILIGSAAQASDEPGYAKSITTSDNSYRYKTFIGAIDDSATFSVVKIYGTANGDVLYAGGTIRYATVAIGSVSGSGLVLTGKGAGDDPIDMDSKNNDVKFEAEDEVDVDLSFTADTTFDTQGNTGVVSSTLSGTGKLIAKGGGELKLTGNNTHQGTLIETSTILAVGSDTALGDSNNDLELDGGVLKANSGFTLGHNIDVTANDGTINTNGNDVTATGNVSGAGCLIKDGNGKLIMTGLVANSLGACVEQGILALNGTITGGAVIEAGGTLQGSGTIQGTINNKGGRLSPGNSPGTLTSVGSVVQGVGSTLEIEIDGYGTANGAGNYDRVLVTGGGNTFTADGELKAVLRGITAPANNTFTPVIGDTFKIVEANGGIVGEFVTLTQPITGLAVGTRFDIIYGDTVITLVVTPTSFGSLPNIALLGNVSNAGGAIDAIRPVGGGAITNADAKNLFDKLTPLSEANLNQALRQISAENKANSIAVVGQAKAETIKVINNRLTSHRHGFKTSSTNPQTSFSISEEADALTKSLANNILGLSEEGNVWGKLIGKYARTGADSNALGYTSKTFGAVIGADSKINDKLTAGLAFSTVNTEIDSDENGTGRVESWQVSGYSSYLPAEDVFVNSSLGFSVEKYREARTVNLAGGAVDAYGSSSGHSVVADVEAGRTFASKFGMLEPFAGFKLDWIKQNSFTENGNQAVTMSFDNKTLTAPQARLGLRGGKKFINNNLDYNLMGSLAWLRDIGTGYYDRSEAKLHNNTFSTYPAKPGKNALEIATGIAFGKNDGVSFTLDYEAELRENRTSHGLALGVKYAW